MNFEIITGKPWWFVIFCIAAGAVYAFALYRREHLLSEVRPWVKKMMAVLRFVAVTVLAFLLLSPMIRTLFRETEKPVIIIAADNSQSVITGTGSAAFVNSFGKSLNRLKENLERNYEVRTFTFGDDVKSGIDFSFTGRQTDISKLTDHLSVLFSNRNVGALIVATDGLYNAGSNPLYSGSNFKVPVYTVALGDTVVKKDILIPKVNHNRMAFLGNAFPVEIIVDARQCAGADAVLTVAEDSVTLFRKNISVAGNRYHLSVPVYIEAKQQGIRHYRIKISELENEISITNNSADVFIEVTASRQKILIVANAPHPDIAALKSVIESNRNYEVKQYFAKNFSNNISGYNLVILHQLPAAENNAAALFERINNSEVPVLYILGAQANVNAFNQLGAGITISESGSRINESQAYMNPAFSLFTVSDELANFVSSMPPLAAPFGIYRSNTNIYALLYQQVGNVRTGQPLLHFGTQGTRKIAVLSGEGIWKWKLKEYSERNNSALTAELVLKIVQYLSAMEIKKQFSVTGENNFSENEPLLFDAELRNEAGELINAPDVKMTVTGDGKKAFPFAFSRTTNTYSLNAGIFPVGNYSYRAETKLGDKIFAAAGAFSVSALQLELSETTADHQLLYAWAEKTGGKMIYPQQMDELAGIIEQRGDVKPVIYTQKKLKDLVNLRWVFILVAGLLAAEWFLRKRSGAY